MSYTFNKIIKGNFDEVKSQVIETLKEEKFGIITEINVQATMKEKLDKDMHRYEILGACNPGYAFKAINADEDMGAFLPCNVTLSEKNEGEIKVSIVDPIAMISVNNNIEISEFAAEVSQAMFRVHEKL